MYKFKFKVKIFFSLALSFIIVIGYSLGEFVSASKQNPVIEILNGSSNEGKSTTLFNESDGLWYPGKIQNKIFNIKNGNEKDFTLNTIKGRFQLKDNNGVLIQTDSEVFKDFNKYVFCRIEHGREKVYQGSFQGLVGNGINIKDGINIKNHSMEEFSITVWMKKNSTNTIQGVEAILDIEAYGKENEKLLAIPKTGSFADEKLLILFGTLLLTIGTIFLRGGK